MPESGKEWCGSRPSLRRLADDVRQLPTHGSKKQRSFLDVFFTTGDARRYVAYPGLKPVTYQVALRPLIRSFNHKDLEKTCMYCGLLILFAVIFIVDHNAFADDGYISEIWPGLDGIIQCMPLMVLELTECGQFKLMRQANTATKRKAALRPRYLFNFVSGRLAAATVIAYFTVIMSDLFVHDFIFDWGHDSIQRAIVLTVTNLVLVTLGAWNLYGRKQNPHQSIEDRNKQISTNLIWFFYVSIAMSVFCMTEVADDVIDIGFLDATLMSLYFQTISFLSIGHAMRTLKLENIEFDVYKNGTALT